MGRTLKGFTPEGAAIGPEACHNATQWAQGVHRAQTRMVEALISSGRLLSAARRSLPPADYQQWLLDSFGWSVDAAEALIAASEFADDRDGDTLDQWQAGALLCLSDPRFSAAAAAAIAEARRGARITARRALELIREHCPEPSP